MHTRTIGFATLGLILAIAPAAFSAAKSSKTTAQPAAKPQPKSDLDLQWTPFPDTTKFEVLGLYWFDENAPKLWRMPAAKFDKLTSGVRARCKAPSGGRIALASNTGTLALRVLPHNKADLKGFDVYLDGRYYHSAIAEEPLERDIVLFKNLDRRERQIVIYLPNQQDVLVEAVGTDKDATFGKPQHHFARPLPVVFYGSSICQGNAASKPGMTYPANLCRRLNLDFVNLGFGGAGKAEPGVVEQVNSIPACCYVFDLGKSYGSQDKTAFANMLRAIRDKHPGVPLICLTPNASTVEMYSKDYLAKSLHTREVMREATNDFIKSGEKNVYLLEGTDMLGFDELDGLSRDGVHPTDYGYNIIATKLVPVLTKALGLTPAQPSN